MAAADPPEAALPLGAGGRRRLTGLRAFMGSTRFRLAGTIVAVTALATILAVVVVGARLDVDLENRIGQALEQERREFGRFLEGEPGQGRRLLVSGRRYISRNILDQGEAIVVVQPGVGVARSVGAPFALDQDPELRASWRTLQGPERRRVSTPAGEAEVLAVPVSHDGRRTGTLVVANFLATERSEVDRAFVVVVQVAIGAIVLVGLLAWAIAGHVLRPLRQVTATAREISEEDTTRRLPERRGDDEVSTLVRTVNGMLDRLDAALTSKRAFLADAGHELRTPLTIVRGNVELLASGVLPPAEQQKTLDLVAHEVDRMSRLVNELLILAQADQPDFLDLHPIDLGDLAARVFERAKSFDGPAWRCAPGHGVVRADAERLTQAALNLVTNAARHSPAGDPVVIGTRLLGDEAELWVADSGPGIPSDLRRRVVERSVRGADRRKAGLGLGLAIAEVIVSAHGGRVEIGRSESGGARVALVIPQGGPR